MPDSEIKARAKNIRDRLNKLSDDDLVNFEDSVYFTEFKLADEHIKYVGSRFDKTLPF